MSKLGQISQDGNNVKGQTLEIKEVSISENYAKKYESK